MNTRLINSAAGVINAALTQNRTAAGIALALDSAGMLMTPETAAELASLRAQFAVSDHSVDEGPIAYAVTDKATEDAERVRRSVDEQFPVVAAFLAKERTAAEDPHDSPLHQTHRISRELPSSGGAS